MPKSVNEVFRDFTRWTGDGLPNEPTGHPLPIGDPRSGLWNPPKHDIRDALGGVFSSASSAATAAATAQYWANVAHVSRSTDPGEWRNFIGIDGDRDAITVDGTYVLDATKFIPNSTVFGGNGTRNYILDVSSAVVGYTYAIFNAGILGDRLTLDCGAEYGFLGFGVTPNNLTTTQITVDPGQVAYITRANLTRVHVYVEGVYWVKPDINNSWRRMDDGTYDVLYRRAGNIAATAEASDIVLPAGFSLDGASVLSVTLQPRTDGASYNGSPPIITKMGTTNGLAANRAAIYNPNSTLMTHPVLIHFSNVTRS